MTLQDTQPRDFATEHECETDARDEHEHEVHHDNFTLTRSGTMSDGTMVDDTTPICPCDDCQRSRRLELARGSTPPLTTAHKSRRESFLTNGKWDVEKFERALAATYPELYVGTRYE